jgi:hypothetical protein
MGMHVSRENYTPPAAPTQGRCPDCGEDLAQPHALGLHLPGCDLSPEGMTAIAGLLGPRLGIRTSKRRRR